MATYGGKEDCYHTESNPGTGGGTPAAGSDPHVAPNLMSHVISITLPSKLQATPNLKGD